MHMLAEEETTEAFKSLAFIQPWAGTQQSQDLINSQALFARAPCPTRD